MHSKAREEDFAQAGTGFSIVNLCEPGDGGGDTLFHGRAQDGRAARLAWDRFRQRASAEGGQKVSIGDPMFLDHFNPVNECRKHLGTVSNQSGEKQ